MTAPRLPIALDARTVESRAPNERLLVTAIKPGAFFDTFKSAAQRPNWARMRDAGTPEDSPENVHPAVEVRGCELRWNDWYGVVARVAERESACMEATMDRLTQEHLARLAEMCSGNALGYSETRVTNREFWKRIEDSLNGGPPAYEIPESLLSVFRLPPLSYQQRNQDVA